MADIDTPKIIISTFKTECDIHSFDFKWESSEVYSHELKLNISDEKIRKSFSSTINLKYFDIFNDSVLKNIILENTHKYKSLWKVLKYTKESFFTLHRDKFDHLNDIATIVIIPPKSVCDYTGGELNLYINSKDFKTVIADDVDWTYCIFDYNVYHEVMPILSGERIVFKNNIITNLNKSTYERSIDQLFNITEEPIDMTNVKIPKPYDNDVNIYEYVHNYIDNICSVCNYKNGDIYDYCDSCDSDSLINMELCKVYNSDIDKYGNHIPNMYSYFVLPKYQPNLCITDNLTKHILNKVFTEYSSTYNIIINNIEHSDCSGHICEKYVVLYDLEKSTSFEYEFSDDGDVVDYIYDYLITCLTFIKK